MNPLLEIQATTLLAAVFLKTKNLWLRIIGGCGAVAAALGFYGLIDNAFLVWALIPLFASLIGLAGIVLLRRRAIESS
jgi:hypothetical protein